MDRRQAEHLYDSGKEPTVIKLLEYDNENTQLKQKIAGLEKDSTNSSKPPSSDRFKPTVDRPPKEKDKERKPGGQPGHQGTPRTLIPVEDVDDVIHYYPEKCKICSESLPRDGTGKEVGEPFRWQITEIPPIYPIIIEHQFHTLKCECGCCTKANIPSDITESNFGPRVMSIIAYMTAVLHVPRRPLQEYFETLFNVKISVGSIQNMLEKTSLALESTVKRLQDSLSKQPVINADETGWRNRWLWIFVAKTFIFFRVAKSRSSRVLKDVLGDRFTGILVVDRWGAYTKYHKGIIQICWAHLKRDFKGILKLGEKTRVEDAILFAGTMENLRKQIMALWYRFKEGEITRTELIDTTAPVRNKLKSCLEKYGKSEEKYVRTFANNLVKRFDHLFTFIFYEGVEPTNNISERGIRPAVQWRKICFGNRSNNGELLTSRLLTVTRTCWLQKKNPLEFLVCAVTAHLKGKTAPSLT